MPQVNQSKDISHLYLLNSNITTPTSLLSLKYKNPIQTNVCLNSCLSIVCQCAYEAGGSDREKLKR